MSSKSEKHPRIEYQNDYHFNIKNYIIRFSRFFTPPAYIYSGEEKIPFKDRLPEYKQILLHEFGEAKKHNILK
ncbi:MAG: hypothetical protein ACXAES_10725 [Promethearchaeota archaeon]|jgi:hypothetical protein